MWSWARYSVVWDIDCVVLYKVSLVSQNVSVEFAFTLSQNKLNCLVLIYLLQWMILTFLTLFHSAPTLLDLLVLSSVIKLSHSNFSSLLFFSSQIVDLVTLLRSPQNLPSQIFPPIKKFLLVTFFVYCDSLNLCLSHYKCPCSKCSYIYS